MGAKQCERRIKESEIERTRCRGNKESEGRKGNWEERAGKIRDSGKTKGM